MNTTIETVFNMDDKKITVIANNIEKESGMVLREKRKLKEVARFKKAFFRGSN